jgi:hypothetical protein
MLIPMPERPEDYAAASVDSMNSLDAPASG